MFKKEEKIKEADATATKNEKKAKLPNTTAEKEKPTELKQLSQKDSVYLAVTKVIEQDKVKLDEKPILKKVITKDQLEKVHDLVCEDLSSKKCRLKDTEGNRRKLSDPAELRKYVKGMVQNWFRRDDRLNGEKNFK